MAESGHITVLLGSQASMALNRYKCCFKEKNNIAEAAHVLFNAVKLKGVWHRKEFVGPKYRKKENHR